MRYEHTFAQSAEFLRQAVKRMSQQEAGLHPFSYAIWYEYVSGINRDLQIALDARLASKGKLDDPAACALYYKHVADLDAKTALRIGDSVGHLVDHVADSASHAGDQASHYSDSLERWSETLQRPATTAKGAPPPPPGLADILRGTRDMQKAISDLQERLENSSREAQELRQEVARAREEALVDGLTGLANRKGFDLALAAGLQQDSPPGPGPCLLMIDLDHFKRLNDSHGHLFGDKVLAGIGEMLRANVKGKDTAARYGGEEFAVILPRTPRGGAVGLAEALRALVASRRIRNGGNKQTLIGNITVSIGIADYVAGESAADFIARADQALYEAKAQGRNRVSLAPRPQPNVPST
ncbi:MAG: putative diguanylate cyclase YdaM [Candidatus Accumulibacter appositus]|uniref:diguanylate cyclase n=1 Tax=Candidatus Accumulibacter appositus TaxID=1454003 RepID=A0A011PU98_9PROT|nr:GGDEF domain-containing protein [Accumulibacter sp.]EXI80612.1 MAG: putative diguanylate cyclase YdaM [Candidatus Accumulibacter appositus]HRF05607.1 GGDEF domain-containing protein [Accumulibacter sp.]